MASSQPAITQLLNEWSDGRPEAMDRLMPLVHRELRRLAASYLRRRRADYTLQPTELINEAYLRLVDAKNIHWQSRAHFFAIAARLMRDILVDYARSKHAGKRGGGAHRLSLSTADHLAVKPDPDLIALDEALNRLANKDARQSRVVELRFFGGLSIEETAAAMGLSPATVKREWRTAKAWLFREIGKK